MNNISHHHLYFQDKIGQAISKTSISQLNELNQEAYDLFMKSVSEEDRLFYGESLKLIESSLMALHISIHENVGIKKISEVNQIILAIAEQQGKIYQAIQKTFQDSRIAPFIEKKPSDDYQIPYPEVHVKSERAELKNLKEELSKMLESKEYVDSSEQSLIIKDKLAQFDSSVEQFHQIVLTDLWDKKMLAMKDLASKKASPLMSERDPKKEMYTKNVMFDEFSETWDVPDAEFIEGRIVGDGDCGFSSTNTTRKEVIDYLKKHAKDEHIRELVAPEIKGWLLTSVEELKEIIDMESYFVIQDQVDEQFRLILTLIKEAAGISPRLELENMSPEDILLKWDEVKEHLENGEKFKNISFLNDPFKDFVQEYFQLLKEKNQLLNELSLDERVFLTYIDKYYGKGGYLVLPDPELSLDPSQSTGVISVIAEMKNTPVRVWKVVPGEEHTAYLRYQTEASDVNKEQTIDIIHRELHYNKLIPSEKLNVVSPKLNEKKKFAGLQMYRYQV